MLYSELFKRVNGDAISVSTYSVEGVLKSFPLYVEFCEKKVKLRKELEAEFSKAIDKSISFRVYLEHLVHVLLYGTPLYLRFENAFGDRTKEIEGAMKERIGAFIAENCSLPKALEEFVFQGQNYISKAFHEVGLLPFLLKTEFKDLYALKNGQVGLTIFFPLNEEVKEIFEKTVIDDWGERIAYFQNLAVYENGKMSFASTTHEDFYTFFDEEPNS